MKAFHATAGLILLVLIGSQFFRSIYARWIEPHDSQSSSMFQEPSDPESRARIDKLLESKSLAELEKLYAEERDQHGAYAPTVSIPVAGDPYETEPTELTATPTDADAYSEGELSEAIKLWKDRHREMLEVHYFWWCGALCIVLGLLVSKRSAWLATSAIFGGFLEMLFAILPPLVSFGGEGEFDRLLTFKVIYSTISLGALLAIWAFAIRHHRRATAS